MRKMLFLAAVTAAAIGLPASAMAAGGFTTTRMSLRAGPGFDYPIVDRIPSGAAIRIRGCIAGYRWCDVVWHGEYGWARGNDLAFLYHGRRVLVLEYGPEIGLPVVDFSIGTYWREHYRNRPFFARIDQFRGGRVGAVEGRDFQRNVTVGSGRERDNAPAFRHERHNRAAPMHRQMNATAPTQRQMNATAPRTQRFAPRNQPAAQAHMANPSRAQAMRPQGPRGGGHPETVGAGVHGPATVGPARGGGGHGHGPGNAPGHQKEH